MTIPPKWFYTESSISQSYISSKAEYYYDQSTKTWPGLISSVVPSGQLTTIKDVEYQKQFGKNASILANINQLSGVTADQIARYNLCDQMINTLYSSYSTKAAEIKSIYLGKKGIWLVEKDETGKTKDAENPIPVTADNKYVLLWQASENEYKIQKIQNLISSVRLNNNIFILSEFIQKLLFLKDGIPDAQSIAKYKKNPIYYTRTLNPDWPLKSLYIDTLNYNEFAQELRELQALKTRFSKLPPTQQVKNDKKINPETGKEYKPVCDKYFPFDYGKLFGMGGLMQFIPFMKVPEQEYWPDRIS